MWTAFTLVAAASLAPIGVQSDGARTADATDRTGGIEAAHPLSSGSGLKLNRILRELRRPDADVAELAEECATLGSSLAPLAMGLLVERRLPVVDGGVRQVLSDAQETFLLDSLSRVPADAVRRAIHEVESRLAIASIPAVAKDGELVDFATIETAARASKADDLSRRTAVLLALGCVARSEDLAALTRIAHAEIAEGELGTLERAYTVAMRRTLQRDARAYDVLARSWRGVPEVLLPAMIRAAGADGQGTALDLLTQVLEQHGDIERVALAELARQRAPRELSPELSERLLQRLDAESPSVRQAACNALAALGDFSAVDRLTVLLDDSSDGLRSTAHRALMTISGLRLPPTRAGWAAWSARERVWFEDRASALEQSIHCDDPARALRAIAEVGLHRWERHRWSESLAARLDRADTSMAAALCDTLVQLDSPRARPALERLLEQGTDAERGLARAALSRD